MKTTIKTSILILVIAFSSCDSPQVWIDLIYFSADVASIIQYERDRKELEKQPPLRYAGKCIEPCYLSQDYVESGYEIPVYTGNDPDALWVKQDTILLHPTLHRWEKRLLSPEECKYSDSDDCFDWGRVIMPRRDTTLIIVSDTTMNKDYDLIFVPILKAEEDVGTDWREVLCEDALNQQLVRDLYDFLNDAGYVDFKYKKYFTNSLHEALINFQEENALPIGHLDAESLYAMGLGDYWDLDEVLW
jgi:hypothetical protein